MSLLERIAQSNGDPQKTIEALRLLNQRLQRQVAEYAQSLTTQAVTEASRVGYSSELAINSGSVVQMPPLSRPGLSAAFSQTLDLRWPGTKVAQQRM